MMNITSASTMRDVARSIEQILKLAEVCSVLRFPSLYATVRRSDVLLVRPPAGGSTPLDDQVDERLSRRVGVFDFVRGVGAAAAAVTCGEFHEHRPHHRGCETGAGQHRR
jgi:hypothetical protein